FWVDCAITPLLGLIESQVSSLSAVTFLSLCGFVLGAAALAARRRLPGRAAAVGIVALAFAFSGSVAGFDVSRLLSLPGPDGTDLTARRADLNWIDRAVGENSSVATLSYPVFLPPGQPLNTDWFASALHWWDAELWNDSVKFGYV